MFAPHRWTAWHSSSPLPPPPPQSRGQPGTQPDYSMLPNCAAKPRSRRLRDKQTNLHSKPSPSRQAENRIKYPVILCCLRGKHTDLIITSRLADGAMHLQLRGELFPKTITITAAAMSEGKGATGGKLKESRDMETNYGGWREKKSCIWDIKPGLVEKKRKFKKSVIFVVCR